MCRNDTGWLAAWLPTAQALVGGQPTAITSVRGTYSRPGGVKGIKGRKFKATTAAATNDDDVEDQDDPASSAADGLDIDDNQYDHIANSTMHVTRSHDTQQHVYVVQPYVKWGPRKNATSPELQLQEAEALVRSLPGWSISNSIKVPLDSLDKKQLFGTGKLQSVRIAINEMRGAGTRITCIFISKGQLSGVQKRFLEKYFGLPVMDRYSMVIQILRLHATSNEAKLQVAAAELPYIWSQLRDGTSDTPGAPSSGVSKALHTLSDTQKEMLHTRERKLRAQLKRIRARRELLRQRRCHMQFPIVAVVGYTNAGKTSLIKALTSSEDLHPRDQLFATLDVTAHAGLLPSKLKVIYMDTVGFMSDIPTGLIESFVATLEDAMMADIIVHVHDVAHPNRSEQSRHVEQTLRELLASVYETRTGEGKYNSLANVIHVGNKADLMKAPLVVDGDSAEEAEEPRLPADLALISSKTGEGIETLRAHIETELLRVTNRSRITMKVPMGGPESSWLYKNAAVTEAAADPNNAQNLLLSVVISDTELAKFRHQFVKSAKKRKCE